MHLEGRRTAVSILTFTITLVLASAACNAQSNLYLIALMGQSNMVGQGKPSDLPTGFPRNPAKIWNFTNAYKWKPAQEPIDSPKGQLDIVSLDKRAGVGPALAMADAFVASHPSVEVGLIPCAKGGSSISEWLKKPEPPRSTLFGSCINRIKTVSPADGILRAALFWQGARDGKTLETASNWGERFKALIAELRNELDAPDLPIVMIMLGRPEGKALMKYPYWDVVRGEQRAVNIPGLIKIEADGYARQRDGMHFATAGQLAIGEDLARLLPKP